MKKYISFRGGIRLPLSKITAGLRVETLPLAKKLILPAAQNCGNPPKFIVAKGDRVEAGQVIAEPDGASSVPLHAPASGAVKGIIGFNRPGNSALSEAAVIETDGRESRLPNSAKYHEYFRFSPAELTAAVRNAGVVGMGGKGFPAHLKLSRHKKLDVDTLIINACECEPFLSSDDMLLRENPKDIVDGVKIMMFMLDAVRAVIAVQHDKREAIHEIRSITFNEPNIEVAELDTVYPQGSERHLIKTLLNREIPASSHPVSHGIIVNNAATAYAVCRAVKEGEPLTSRIITVAGAGITEPKNLKVSIGTLFSDIAEYCGGTTADFAQVIEGGPMTGTSHTTLETPVLKTTSAVLFLAKNGLIERKYTVCFRCGKCARACPMNLLPNMLSVYIERGMPERAAKYFPSDCIECGCCAYVCPANRPITEQIRTAKAAGVDRLRTAKETGI